MDLPSCTRGLLAPTRRPSPCVASLLGARPPATSSRHSSLSMASSTIRLSSVPSFPACWPPHRRSPSYSPPLPASSPRPSSARPSPRFPPPRSLTPRSSSSTTYPPSPSQPRSPPSPPSSSPAPALSSCAPEPARPPRLSPPRAWSCTAAF